MQIEIAEPGRMTQTGSSLIRLIQNNNMPVLDLLIRESIQNSLDARKIDSKYVEVDFKTGHFKNHSLSSELDELTEALDSRFPNEQSKYLAIRDTNTVGLTGVMDFKKVKDNKYGNLLKLVYEICKPQEAEGAGGSWGIGKTVYFRIGIGLVIYYSRIINEDGNYESRLAASLVENETDADAMIPSYKGMSKRGIAWWGRKVDENITEPITDEEYIHEFLNIFGIQPYQGVETGTTIIIPYIDEENLLSNNRIEYLNDQEQAIIPFWGHKIEDYLSIAAQRWYAPRLNNSYYQQGAYLRMRINGQPIKKEDMEPVFKVVQALYNRASHVSDNDDILVGVDVKTNEINLRKYIEDPIVGVLSFVKVNKDLLQMSSPYNKPEPFMYFNNEIRDTEVNKPTICYTRKPAMIVSYDNVGPWVHSIAPSPKDEYIIGIFVINSFNRLKNSPSPINLEEYIRKSEMADHTSWSDWSEANYNPRFVSKIQSNVNKIISKEFAPEVDNNQAKQNSGLGKMFGDLLLPPDSGTKPSGKTQNSSGGSGMSNRSGLRLGIEESKIRYMANTMTIPIIFESTGKNKTSKAGFDIQVDSESKKIEIAEWEGKMGLDSPFYIRDCRVYVAFIDGDRVDYSEMLNSNGLLETDDIHFIPRVSDNGTWHGISYVSDTPHNIKIRLDVTVTLLRKDIKPSFIFEKGNE